MGSHDVETFTSFLKNAGASKEILCEAEEICKRCPELKQSKPPGPRPIVALPRSVRWNHWVLLDLWYVPGRGHIEIVLHLESATMQSVVDISGPHRVRRGHTQTAMGNAIYSGPLRSGFSMPFQCLLFCDQQPATVTVLSFTARHDVVRTSTSPWG